MGFPPTFNPPASIAGRTFHRPSLRTAAITNPLRLVRLFLGLVLVVPPLAAGVESWSRKMGAAFGTTDLNAVTQQGGRWVVVGNRGLIATSTDGRQWTQRTTGTTVDLQAVAGGGGRYVAGGANGLVLGSSDATTWTIVRPASGSTVAGGAAYGAGVFVIPQIHGTILRSSDGIAWVEQTLPAVGTERVAPRSIVYANGLFVVVGLGEDSSPLIFTSPDGVSWTRRAREMTTGSAGYSGGQRFDLRSVTWGGGQFVAVGDTGVILCSPDGINWLPRFPNVTSPVSTSLTSVAFGNGGFVVGTDGNYHLKSSDGVNWVAAQIPGGLFRFTSLAFSGDRFVAASLSGQIALQAGLNDWERVAGVPFISAQGIAHGNGYFVVTGSQNLTARSADGETWTTGGSGSRDYSRIAFGGGKFVSSLSTLGTHTSVDGITWTPTSFAQTFFGITYARGSFWSTGVAAVFNSADGLSWSTTAVPVPGALLGIADGNGVLVAVGTFGAIATSATGATWQAQSSPTSQQLGPIAFGAGKFIAAQTTSPVLWSSPDGVSWSAVTMPAAPAGGYSNFGFQDLIFQDGRFVGVIGSDVLTSTDGVSWTVYPRALGDASLSFRLAFGNGRFVAAGSGVVYTTEPGPGAPVIASLTGPAAVLSGQPATLQVTASGSSLTYQWYRGDAGNTTDPVAGATSASLALSSVTANARYWVRISNGTTFMDSGPIDVRVGAAPTLAASGRQQIETPADQPFTFTAAATGVPAPTLQWYRGLPGDTSQPVDGATSGGLVMLPGSEVQRFWVRATNLFGSADSPEFKSVPWTPSVGGYYFANVRKLGADFVAVGGSDVLTSTDGRGWRKRSTIANALLRDVVFSSGLYVAVGERGFYTSNDLVSWTQRNLPGSPATYNGAICIARGNGVYVAVGFDTFASANGIDWTKASLPTGVQLLSVTFDGSKFVAGGRVIVAGDENRAGVGVLFTSTDGLNWTRRGEAMLPEIPANSTTAWDRVEFLGGKYLATSSEAGYVAASADALSWTKIRVPLIGGGRLRTIAHFAGRFILGTEANGYLVSTDAQQWQTALAPAGMSASTLLVAGSELFAYGTSGVTYATTDAASWQFRAFTPPTLHSIAYGGGRFVGLGAGATYVSEDGLAWRVGLSDVSEVGSNRVAYAAGLFTVVSDEGGIIHQSSDGERWKRVRVSTNPSPYSAAVSANNRTLLLTGSQRDAAFGGGVYVIVGSDISRSTDATTWTTQPLPSGQFLAAVTHGKGLFVAVGVNGGAGLILTSPDGASWTPRTSPLSTNAGLHDVVFTNGRFFMATSEGLLHSGDGIAWESSPSLAPLATALAAVNGQVLGMGTGSTIWVRAPDASAPSVIAISPAAQIASGGTTNLTVTAVGASLTYQWYRGESGDTAAPVAGATSALFATPATTASTRYWVRLTGTGGVADSKAVLVWVAAPPTIKLQPFSAEVLTVDNSFSTQVEVESVAPVSYQWYQGSRGNTLHPVLGATGPTLAQVPPATSTRYWVRVSNSFGHTDSEEVSIAVWERKTFPEPAAAFATAGVAAGNGQIVVTGRRLGDTGGTVQRSADGIAWTIDTTPGLGPIAFGAGRFVASTLVPGFTLYHSNDAVIWTSVSLPALAMKVTNVLFVGGRFVALSSNGQLATSSDGQSWSISTAGSSALKSAAYGNGKYIVAGEGAALFTSTDALTWTPVAGAPLTNTRGLAFDGTRFLALDAEGVLFASSDGSAWTAAPVVTSDGWLNLKAGPGLSHVAGLTRGIQATAPWSYASRDGNRWWPAPAIGRYASLEAKVFGVNVTAEGNPAGTGFSAGYGGQFFRQIPEPETPLIVTPPVAQTLFAGGALTLSVDAVGAGDLAYQWRRNGVNLPGQTTATLVIPTTQSSDAGSYDVIVSNARGDTLSAAVPVVVVTPVLPVFTTQPAPRAVNTGETVTFQVAATGTPAPTFQWRKNSTPIPGATSATLTLSSVQPADGGLYSAVATNLAGPVTSAAARLSVTPVGMVASHQVVDGGYVGGGTLTVSNTLATGTEAAGFKWDVLLPDGWSFASSTGDAGSTKPTAGMTGLLSWQWTSLPPGTVTFNYVVNAPVGASGVQLAAALVTRTASAVSIEFLARPDPLAFVPSRHSADTDANGAISLSELTRVIELYNTRNGTTRTGAYRRATATTEDGFAADEARTDGQLPAFTGLHTADSSRNGTIDLFELTRVIQLYNHREGTLRTGRYRVQPDSEDGFAPGS